MELLLGLRYSSVSKSTHQLDVRVEVDPEDTVGALTEALGEFAAQHGYQPPGSGLMLVRTGATQPLDPTEQVVASGLVSGEAVTLGDGVGTRRPWQAQSHGAPASTSPGVQAAPGDLRSGPGLTLDVTAGPGVGRVVSLSRDLTVGRAARCTVAIDDPAMAGEHFAVRVAPGGRIVVVPNPLAAGGVTVAGQPVEEPHEVRIGQLIEAGSSTFTVRTGVAEETRRRDLLGQVPFNRVPYRRTVVRAQRLDELPAPPDTPSSGKLSIATTLMPAFSAAGMALMFGNAMFLLIAAGTPVLAIMSHFGSRRGGKRRFRKDKATFLDQVEEAVTRVDEALGREREARLMAAPDLAELARQAMLHMPRLWERDRLAGDLLDLRLGLGQMPSQVTLDIATGGDDQLRTDGEARLAHQRTVGDVPVTVDLLDVGALGLWGDRAQVGAVGRALVVQAACLHSPEDLVVAAAVDPEGEDGDDSGFGWLKWLPHVRSATSPLEGDHLAPGADATKGLLVRLLKVVADRAERSQTSNPQTWPRVLFVVEEAALPDRALLSQLLDVAPGFGIHVVWLGESQLQVPRQCRAMVSCAGNSRVGHIRFTDPNRDDQAVELDGADPATSGSIARSLAPLRDASASSQTTAIPRVVPLLDVVGLDDPTPEAIAERWQQPAAYALDFPIGMSAEGSFGLDLVEHGPHTLIGGTSGSGKSELLQSLVLSLAANHPPGRLTFLFVDYKGGASSAELRDLPHTVGYVTNLDGRMSLRALTSLQAELQRRMAMMEGRAKDLREMLQVAPEQAPPSLVIVVDEFAALVKTLPDFMTGMVDIAQRGRSLGVHLILATQRPTGVVNDNILANTNLRISLRVLDPSDSQNIIGTRDAAEIPVPLRGRGYARTGPQALVPFQCAWSGAPVAIGDTARAVTVHPFDVVGDDQAADGDDDPSPAAGADGADVEPPTQLDAVVDACAGAARSLALPQPRRPWLEPLPEALPLDEVLARPDLADLSADPGRIAIVGLDDDPANQAQNVTAIDLEATGGLMVFGTGGTGKTTLLRTLAAGFARQGTPDEVQIYALDFASRSLDPLIDLPHCAAVVSGDEVERTCRLLTLLDHEIDRRRVALAEARAENLGALRRQSGNGNTAGSGFPRLVVLVDGYGGFHATFDRADRFAWLGTFQRILSTGRQVGVHFVLTSDRRMGVPPALLSAIGARLALRMATDEDLASLGVPTKVARGAELPPGRGFLDGTVEAQVACVSADPSALAQAEALADLAEELAAGTGERTPVLPELPTRVVLPPEPAAPERPYRARFGVMDLSLDPVYVDLRRQNMVVLGPPLAGKSTALATVVQSLRASTGPDVLLAALGTPASPLRGLDLWDDAAFTRADHAGVAERLVELTIGEDPSSARAALFVDAAEDLDGYDVLTPLETLAKSEVIRLVVACEAATLSAAYSGWLSHLRRNRAALMLQPESKVEVETTAGVKPDLRPEQDFPPGRGIFVANRRWQLVQVAQTDQVPDPQAMEEALR